MSRKIGKKRQFIREYRNFANENELEKIYNKSYRLTGIMKKLNPNTFLKADGDARTRSELALNISKEYAWGIATDNPSRLSLYLNSRNQKISMEERILIAEKETYHARLNYKNKSEESFLEKYGDVKIIGKEFTIKEALEMYENDEINKLQLNDLIKEFKDKNPEFEGLSRERYEKDYDRRQTDDYFI